MWYIKGNGNRVKSRFCTHIFQLFSVVRWFFVFSGLNVCDLNTLAHFQSKKKKTRATRINPLIIVSFPDKNRWGKTDKKHSTSMYMQPWSSFISHLIQSVFVVEFLSIPTVALFHNDSLMIEFHLIYFSIRFFRHIFYAIHNKRDEKWLSVLLLKIHIFAHLKKIKKETKCILSQNGTMFCP